MKIESKLTELEKIMLREEIQSQKNKVTGFLLSRFLRFSKEFITPQDLEPGNKDKREVQGMCRVGKSRMQVT